MDTPGAGSASGADAVRAMRDELAATLRPGSLTEDEDAIAPHLREWRDLWHGATPFMLRPADTAEVAAVAAAAARHKVALVPQGGNTGLVGGQIPFGAEVLVSLERLDAIERVDPAGNTVTVGAGAILADVQRAADEVDRMFPLSLASEGSARIGGLISTNAGGTAVLAHGNMREQVLGLEVVLADGRVWNGLRALRKDNTGYDLKHLFIGAEGTLGIITRAVLKLVPKPLSRDVAVVGLASPEAAVALLGRVRADLAEAVTAFELVPRFGLELVLTHGSGVRNPFAGGLPEWAVLMEVSTYTREQAMREALEATLAAAYEDGAILDAVVSQSLTEAGAFWRLRELLSEMQGKAGGSIKHDVSVPVADVPAFIAEASAAARTVVPGARPLGFGHVGDGNVHFNVSQPEGADKAEYLAQWEAMNAAVHAVARRYNGSIAAEHGVGRLKAGLVGEVRDTVELDLMMKVKRLFDPDGLLNPGRVLPHR